MNSTMQLTLLRSVAPLTLAALLAGCAGMSDPTPAPRKEFAYAVTDKAELIKFNTGEPQRILETKKIEGLPAGDRLLGIDFRVARGVLYTVSNIGRLYTLDTATATLKPVTTENAPSGTFSRGPEPVVAGYPFNGTQYGFDFNPAADRIRLVSDTGMNLRLHPDTGWVVDGDPAVEGIQPDTPLHYAAGDVNAGKKPTIVAAGYTYNKQNDKITTNYAIDRDLGVLVMQGSLEGATPVVSPNTGSLRTVGPLGVGAVRDASFDIADVSGVAFAVLRAGDDLRSRLHIIDLKTGRASPLGVVGNGAALIGFAIEP